MDLIGCSLGFNQISIELSNHALNFSTRNKILHSMLVVLLMTHNYVVSSADLQFELQRIGSRTEINLRLKVSDIYGQF